MNNLYDVLEVCLQELERGADLESVLFRYPDLAEELRPILEGSVQARTMASLAPSAEAVRRNRSKVLQHAANLREAGARPSPRVWFASLRRVAVTLAVLFVLFASSTGLVRAASNTLPGDQLYPVKRTWESVIVLFTFDTQQREALEVEHENERLHELQELFAEGRAEEVDFSGTVTSWNGNELVVAGVRVLISSQTEVRDGPISLGSAVRVRGHTQGDGVVLAERIRLLSGGENLPDIEVEDHSGKGSDDEDKQDEDNSGPGSGDDQPEPDEPDNDNDNGSDNSGSGKDDRGPQDNSNSNDNSNDDSDNSGSDSSNDSGSDNSGSHGGNDDNSNQDGGDDSGGGGDDNSGSGGGGDGDDD